YFLDRDRLFGELQFEQAAQGTEALRLVVDKSAVFLENLVIIRSASILELVDRFGIEQVVLAFAAVLVMAPNIEGAAVERSLGISVAVPFHGLRGDYVHPHAGHS